MPRHTTVLRLRYASVGIVPCRIAIPIVGQLLIIWWHRHVYKRLQIKKNQISQGRASAMSVIFIKFAHGGVQPRQHT